MKPTARPNAEEGKASGSDGRTTTPAAPAPSGFWIRVSKGFPLARALADRHYSRQSPGSPLFLPPGKCLCLWFGSTAGAAVWGAVENLDPAGATRWRVTIFRNESSILSSVLIREATDITHRWWREHYGALPAVPLETEVDPTKVRHKRDQGRCFRRAGWSFVEERHGHGRHAVVLRAP